MRDVRWCMWPLFAFFFLLFHFTYIFLNRRDCSMHWFRSGVLLVDYLDDYIPYSVGKLGGHRRQTQRYHRKGVDK